MTKENTIKKEEEKKETMTIAKRFKEYRFHKRLSQKDFAKYIDVGIHTIYSIEQDQLRLSQRVILKLLKHSDVNIIWLLTGQGYMIKTPVENIESKLSNVILQKAMASFVDIFKEIEKETKIHISMQDTKHGLMIPASKIHSKLKDKSKETAKTKKLLIELLNLIHDNLEQIQNDGPLARQIKIVLAQD